MIPIVVNRVQVIAVERNGRRRYAFAEIMRHGGTATLGPWQVNGDGDVPQGWLLELLEEGHSDRALKAEPPPVGELSASDLQDLMGQHPEQVAAFQDLGRYPCPAGPLNSRSNAKGR